MDAAASNSSKCYPNLLDIAEGSSGPNFNLGPSTGDDTVPRLGRLIEEVPQQSLTMILGPSVGDDTNPPA